MTERALSDLSVYRVDALGYFWSAVTGPEGDEHCKVAPAEGVRVGLGLHRILTIANTPGGTMKALLVGQAYVELLYADIVRQRGFRALRELLLRTHVRAIATGSADEHIAAVVGAIGMASMFYCKRIWCLQRSVAVARLLRRRGVDAKLVIGCRALPLESHAWVVVGDQVVSDSLYDLAYFRILDQW